MGTGRVEVAVTDAGPLIHLAEIDCLRFLRIFDDLHIPDAVWSETVGQKRVEESDISKLDNVQRHSLSQAPLDQFIQDHKLGELHVGELEALYLCNQIGVSVLLTDDLAVRRTAKQFGLTPVGSLGIVVRAYREELINLEEAEQHLIDLYDVSTLFVTRAIVELATQQLHKRSNGR
ncbi:MAG: hypothetical protein MAG451_03212 [Anaerolineales bacterium]|nr:hypothetical protein [Anaerolineales bacterium]